MGLSGKYTELWVVDCTICELFGKRILFYMVNNRLNNSIVSLFTISLSNPNSCLSSKMEFTNQIKSFKRIGGQEYLLKFSVGLKDQFSRLDHAAEVLIPMFEELMGAKAFGIYFQENQRELGEFFSMRIDVDLRSSAELDRERGDKNSDDYQSAYDPEEYEEN